MDFIWVLSSLHRPHLRIQPLYSGLPAAQRLRQLVHLPQRWLREALKRD